MTVFVLASSSPRRRDLLAQLGVTPDFLLAPEIDETPRSGELPRAYVNRMAREKAQAAAARAPQPSVLLAADTTVACGRRILPAATTPDLVDQCLRLLSGRRHTVHTAVAVVDAGGRLRERLSATVVQFKRLSDAERAAYVACGEGLGKAGGYAIQGRAAAFVSFLSGSYSGVVGLPLHEVRQLLTASGLP